MNKKLIDTYIEVKHSSVIAKAILRKSDYGGKVFCIGFNKTGTTSLGKSLAQLGYRNFSFNRVIWREKYADKKIKDILKIASKFDSFDDLPWLKEDMIPVLDKTFPNSKFIYLERDEKSWKNSMYHWTFKKTGVYPNIEDKLKEFKAHQDFVFEYFRDRPKEDFIVLNIRDDMGFKKLADFLGKESIADKFPHFNKT